MTSVDRDGGRGKGEESLWDQAVAAVVSGFEGAFDVTASDTSSLGAIRR